MQDKKWTVSRWWLVGSKHNNGRRNIQVIYNRKFPACFESLCPRPRRFGKKVGQKRATGSTTIYVEVNLSKLNKKWAAENSTRLLNVVPQCFEMITREICTRVVLIEWTQTFLHISSEISKLKCLFEKHNIEIDAIKINHHHFKYNVLMQLYQLEILSRSEILYAICDYCSCRTKKHLHFWKTTYIYKDLTELQYAQYLCTRCLLLGSERVKCVVYKLLLRTFFASSAIQQLTSAHMRTRMVKCVALKIHFPVPKSLCKQGTKNVFDSKYK